MWSSAAGLCKLKVMVIFQRTHHTIIRYYSMYKSLGWNIFKYCEEVLLKELQHKWGHRKREKGSDKQVIEVSKCSGASLHSQLAFLSAQQVTLHYWGLKAYCRPAGVILWQAPSPCTSWHNFHLTLWCEFIYFFLFFPPSCQEAGCKNLNLLWSNYEHFPQPAHVLQILVQTPLHVNTMPVWWVSNCVPAEDWVICLVTAHLVARRGCSEERGLVWEQGWRNRAPICSWEEGR